MTAEAGTGVDVDVRKWPDIPERRVSTVSLGADEHGTWLGHLPAERGALGYLFLIPRTGWWIGRHFPDGGWTLDVTTPAAWGARTVTAVDLELDVRRLHGVTWIEDADELEARRDRYPPAVAAAERAAVDLLERLDGYADEFGAVADDWLGCLHERHIEQPTHHLAVLFDMGGVLAVPNGTAHRDAWCERLAVDPATLHDRLLEAIGPGWEGGRRATEIRARLAGSLAISIEDADRMVGDLHADQCLDPMLVEAVSDVRARVRVGVLSNNGVDVRRHWRRAHHVEEHFWPIVVSGEERIAKPDPRIYRIAAARAGVPVSGCLFVDDSVANVEPAISVGMHRIHHADSADSARRIRRWLADRGAL